MKGLWALGFGLWACLGTPRAQSPAPPEAVRVVQISSFAFAPAELTVRRGDTVVWLNQDAFPHTTTADSAAWSSPELARSGRFTFVAGRAGRYPYHCAAHPVMRGVLVVSP
jgi:plastocyanin